MPQDALANHSTVKRLPLGRIVTGDCLKTMRRWPAASVDLAFADPPYNIGFDYQHHYDDRLPHDEYVDWTERWIWETTRLLKPSGSLYILIGDEYAADVRLILRDLQQDSKLLFRNWIIWHYTFGQRCKIKFNRSHAHLFYCVGSAALNGKSKPRSNLTQDPPFTFNFEPVAIPSARQTTYKDARANPKGKLPDDTWYLRSPDEDESDGTENDSDRWYHRPQPAWADGQLFRDDDDTWFQSRLCGTFNERQDWHPCQLPEALLERIIKVSSHPGDTVFDPFVGSGTTLAVARRLGRRWLGCEQSKEYAKRARERVREVQVADRDRRSDPATAESEKLG